MQDFKVISQFFSASISISLQEPHRENAGRNSQSKSSRNHKMWFFGPTEACGHSGVIQIEPLVRFCGVVGVCGDDASRSCREGVAVPKLPAVAWGFGRHRASRRSSRQASCGRGGEWSVVEIMYPLLAPPRAAATVGLHILTLSRGSRCGGEVPMQVIELWPTFLSR